MLDALVPAALIGFWITLVTYRHWTSLALWLRKGATQWLADGMAEVTRVHGFRMEKAGWRVAVGTRGEDVLRFELAWVGNSDREEAHNELVVRFTSPRLPRSVAFESERELGDVVTGDTPFDDAVEALGNPTVLAALLSQHVRDRLRRLVAWNGAVHDGSITWRMRTTFSPTNIPWAVQQVLELAGLLASSESGGLCERLARNTKEDPVAGVRLWNLTLLQQEFPQTAQAAAASACALDDKGPWLRLAAARFLPRDGMRVLRELLEDRRTPDHAAAEAAGLLAARLPSDEAGALLLQTLKVRAGETRRQVIQELGRLKHGPAVGALCVLLQRAEPREAAVAAAALAAIGDAGAERHLLDALKREAPELRTAIARALGAVGTVRAVQPLLELQAERPLSAETRQALREAVAAIQSRLAGAEAGQLTLASTSAETGRLSLATPRPGEGDVSLVGETADVARQKDS